MIAAWACGAAAGATLGSFAAASADRLVEGRAPWRGRSRCGSCGERIAFYDLVPLVSYLALRGACRRCGGAIPRHLPLAEAAGASLGALGAAAASGEAWTGAATLAVLGTALAVAAQTDARDGYVYDAAIYPALAILALLAALAGRASAAAQGLALCAAALALLVAGTRGRGMGLGDVKLAAMIGVALGPSAGLRALAAAFVWGAIVTLALAGLGRAHRGSRVAFAPFLALGALTSLLLAYAEGPI